MFPRVCFAELERADPEMVRVPIAGPGIMFADSHCNDRGPSGPGSFSPRIPLAFESLCLCLVSSAYTSKASTSTERHPTKAVSTSPSAIDFPSLSTATPPTKLLTVRGGQPQVCEAVLLGCWFNYSWRWYLRARRGRRYGVVRR